ncbi:MAG: transcription-repair-coupling factor [Lysobacteraceae bacterium]|nr:MAG: transcription-repair-coupling factor [Xanthomonadaceae bacterium]
MLNLPTTGPWPEPAGCALALAISERGADHNGITLVVTADSHQAHQLEAELKVFAECPVVHFPDWETLPYDPFAPHPDIVSQRLATLASLPDTTQAILVVPVQTLLQRLCPRRYLDRRSLLVQAGGKLNIDSLRQRLVNAGYSAVPQVNDPGEFAVRGGLIDLYPMGASAPFRLELFDDEVDSIRKFDPETQRSSEPVNKVELLPAREFPFDKDAADRFCVEFRRRFEFDPRRCPLFQDARAGVAASGMEYYLPLFFDQTSWLLDYIEAPLQIIAGRGWRGAAETFIKQAEARYEQRRYDLERPILPPQELFLTMHDLHQAMEEAPLVVEIVDAKDGAMDTRPAPTFDIRGSTAQQQAFVEHLDQSRTLIMAESAGRREFLSTALLKLKLSPQTVDSWPSFRDGDQRLALMVADVDRSAQLDSVSLLTESQLFGERARQVRNKGRSTASRDPAAIIRDLTDLHINDPVVHEDVGVGRYQGLVTLDVGDTEGEFLTIEYAEGGKLYVPVASMHLVSRYTGASPENAPLHKLGGEQWSKARKRAAKKIRDVAAELLDLYARRAASSGHAFKISEQDYEKFAGQFPFEETPDQQRSIDQVLADMRADTAMDRVVCGDVGFGKTEVAVRAAFVAVSSSKQVAVLVPTTLLAQQHHRNFCDRFADWPVRVEVLSRFRSKKEVDRVVEACQQGQVDILIGTHRLLQKDIGFKNLGLVIVDEEQRFGVRQKEKLKAMRAEVDLLTLTATPIPRTLNMSLAGIRDLSIIATPPTNRTAVKTFIAQWDNGVIREACQRELARGGQVYFLHNEVKTIEKIGRDLAELVPEARIRIAHGQMPERELEQIMVDFYRQRFHILLCTTIIENGIDVSTANTIIMNRADKLGLAQLHQLRGRVGRSHHRAYAYLLTPDKRSMTSDAMKRLEAIESLGELGAGFTLATHDLEIRGAGELLGDDQSGQIHEIGFELYSELLDRAVTALKSGEEPDLEKPLHHRIEIDLHAPALLPEDWLPDVHMRLIFYKRIASAAGLNALNALRVEMIDRFGLLPDPAKHLFDLTELRQELEPVGVKQVSLDEDGGFVEFDAAASIDPNALIRLIQAQPTTYRFDGQTRLRISKSLDTVDRRIALLQDLIGKLHKKAA